MSLLLTIFLMLGKYCETELILGIYTDLVPIKLQIFVVLLTVVGFWRFIYIIILQFNNKLLKLEFTYTKSKMNYKTLFFTSFFFILFCWSFQLLRYWPGGISGDNVWQLYQITGIGWPHDHHPYAHTLLIKLFYLAGYHTFGNANAGVATFIIFQMIVMSAIYSFTLTVLYKSKLKLIYILSFLAFYALMPIVGNCSISLQKNALFSGFMLLYSLSLWQLCIKHNEEKKLLYILIFIISAIIISLFQSNGVFALFFSVPFVIYYLRKQLLTALTICAIPILLFVFIKGPLWNHMQVIDGDFIESLSMPLQQVARVVVDDNELNEDEIEIIESIIYYDRIDEVYSPYLSDPIKALAREKGSNEVLDNNKIYYLQFWFRLGLKYPKSYINAFLQQTYGYWYPEINTDNRVYLNTISPNSLGIVQSPILDGQIGDMVNNALVSNSLPLFGLLRSSGIYIYALIILLTICFIRKNYKLFIIFFPNIIIWATLLIATPHYSSFRYILSLAVTLPLLISIVLIYNNNEIENYK